MRYPAISLVLPPFQLRFSVSDLIRQAEQVADSLAWRYRTDRCSERDTTGIASGGSKEEKPSAVLTSTVLHAMRLFGSCNYKGAGRRCQNSSFAAKSDLSATHRAVVEACVKAAGYYNTPCVDDTEQIVGGHARSPQRTHTSSQWAPLISRFD
jgi:hypothetical protein